MDGLITANGMDAGMALGAAAGGAIHLNASTLTGSGTITANGGLTVEHPSWSDGGGGGMIALYFKENTFTGNISVRGGAGFPGGGTGTVYRRNLNEPRGQIIIDPAGNPTGDTWLYPEILADEVPPDLGLRGRANAVVTAPFTVGNCFLRDASTLTHYARQNVFDVTAKGDIVIEKDVLIDVSGKGFGPNEGPGVGAKHPGNGCSSGAGHGGQGGFAMVGVPGEQPIQGGPFYDNVLAEELGSGGGVFTWGGGRVKLVATGKLVLNGKILADGQDNEWPSKGAASGGSIHLRAAIIEGYGHVSATGGTSPEHTSWCDGGGGGGRIAVLYEVSNSLLPDMFDVIGGLGFGDATPGSPGTLHIEQVPVTP